MRGVIAVFALAGLVALASCEKKTDSSTSATSGAQPGRLRIAVIPKGTTHDFWKSVDAGAQEAGKELNVDIVWKGPLKENDRAEEISIVEQFVSEKISAIVVAPLDDVALAKPVREATAAKIPVVIFDSALKATVGKDFVSFVATDNKKGGMIGGQELVRLMGAKGKVVLLRYMEGSASTTEREAGFLEVIHQNPNMQVILENRYAGSSVDEAKDAAMNLLDQIKQADGIFCPNESATQGVLLALRQAGLVGKIKFVGFDATPKLVDALKANELQALVAQNPRKMGYESVKTAVAAIRGETVSQRIDTGVELITAENLNTPDIQKLTAP